MTTIDWTNQDYDPLSDIQSIIDDALNNTGWHPLCLRVGKIFFCNSQNRNEYASKFENGSFHQVNPPLTYQQIVNEYGKENVHPMYFFGFV